MARSLQAPDTNAGQGEDTYQELAKEGLRDNGAETPDTRRGLCDRPIEGWAEEAPMTGVGDGIGLVGR
jgi:hypothetical protein